MGNRSRQMQVEEVGNLVFLENKSNRIQIWQGPNRTLFDLYVLTASDELRLSSLIIAAQNRKELYPDKSNVLAPLKILGLSSERGCPDRFSFEVMFEHVDKRLSEVGELSEVEIIFIMHQSLLGFGHIFKNQRIDFEVNDKMICFSPQRKVKVWFNQSIEAHQPSFQQKLLPGSDLQQNLITSVVRSCEKHCSQGRFSVEFYEHLRKSQKTPLKFGDIIRNIKNYVFQRHRENRFLVQAMREHENAHEDIALRIERRTRGGEWERPRVAFGLR